MFDLGIIGDGQLAKMLAEAKLAEGLSIAFLGKDSDGPCSGLGRHIVGDIYNTNDILTFVNQCELCTFENEFIDFEALLVLKDSKFSPSAKSIFTIGDKLSEKQLARDLGIPIGAFRVLSEVDEFEIPCVIKAIKGGYDGYGTFLIRDMYDKKRFLEKRDLSLTYILEDFVSLKRELAVTFARSKKEEDFFFYPIVESVQEDGICVRVDFPAQVSENQKKLIENSCMKLANEIDYHGIMSVEFFETEEGEILYNECSPRPHNSAHYTMDVFDYSQFDLHLVAILGRELPVAKTEVESAVMINLLGNKKDGEKDFIPELFAGEKIHLYNKKQSRIGRKMGHLNILGDDKTKIIQRLKTLEKEVKL
ncbi:MAG: ATP-grasp domain-containing protein [Bdellovibrionota bacterium]|nr:ATP-grasp domain-containing protein [Bdellovibrionota bacterium]